MVRQYIGLLASLCDGQWIVQAAATESEDSKPCASVHTTHTDPRVAVSAALNRLCEKLYISGRIANPVLDPPPITVYVHRNCKKYVPENVRTLCNAQHWSLKKTREVLR